MFFRTLTLIALLPGCATMALPDPSSLPEAPAKEKEGRILLQEKVVRFMRGDDGEPVSRTMETLQAQVLGEGGQWLRDLTVVEDTFDTVEDATLASRFPDGTQKIWTRDDADDVPAVGGYVLYQDARLLRIRQPPVPKETIIGQGSTVLGRSPQLFAFTHGFGASVPVDVSRFVVEVPTGWSIEFVAERLGTPTKMEPSVADEDGVRRYVWERKNVARPKTVTRGLWDEQHERVWVRLKSWTQADGSVANAPADDGGISKFVAELHKDRAAASQSIAATTKKVLAGVGDEPRAKARRLYSWVRDNIRYCAVYLGMGGWVPHDADEVHKYRYGDCKDKANLLKTMLASAGIESRLALVHAGEWPGRFRLPTLTGNFNHAILMIELPEGRVVVDPTSRAVPFDDLPDVDEDRQILPVALDGAHLVDAPSSSLERDVRNDEYDLTLARDGKLRGTFTSTMNGAYADRARELLLYMARGRHDEVAEREVAILDPKVEELAIENAAPPEEVTPLVFRGRCTVTQARGGIGDGDIVLRAATLFSSSFPAVDDEAGRPGPFLLGHRRATSETVRIALPDGLRVGALPDPIVIDTAFGGYEQAWTASDDGRTLTLSRKARAKVRVVEEKDIARYRELAEQARAADELPVALVRGTP